VIAWVGHAFTHAMHMIQSSDLSGAALLSTISNTFIGQISTQTPSPSHASLTVTVGILSPIQTVHSLSILKVFRGRKKIE
jgi:hypothetical protein